MTNLKFDIAGVSFRTEIDMLNLCLSSIDKKFDFNTINKILVVWNHDEPSTADEITHLYEKFSIYTKVSKKLEILPRKTVLGPVKLETLRPWRMQQALKLKAAQFLEMDHVLMVDTKNHFLRPVEFSDFFDEKSVPFVMFRGYGNGPFGDFLRGSFDYFNVPFEAQYQQKALPTTTPYMLHRRLVCDMLDDIENRENLSFSQAFLTRPKLMKTTEFLLYYAYLMSVNDNLNELYHHAQDRNVTFFRTDPDTDEKIQKKLQQLKDVETISMGVHRDRYLTMSKAEELDFINVWLESGLMESRGEAIDHIGNVRDRINS